jgi:hypothetical protein
MCGRRFIMLPTTARQLRAPVIFDIRGGLEYGSCSTLCRRGFVAQGLTQGVYSFYTLSAGSERGNDEVRHVQPACLPLLPLAPSYPARRRDCHRRHPIRCVCSPPTWCRLPGRPHRPGAAASAAVPARVRLTDHRATPAQPPSELHGYCGHHSSHERPYAGWSGLGCGWVLR